MKTRHIAAPLLAGMAVMTGNAHASASCVPAAGGTAAITCALVQTAKPLAHAYPGVDASILGIQTGMTVSQVEAIAAKRGLGRPQEVKSRLYADYHGTYTQSQSFISQIAYQSPRSGDLTIYFSNPATGNAVYKIKRSIVFANISAAPFMYEEASALVKKYGPTSYETYGEYTWQFASSSLEKCPNGQCPGHAVGQGPSQSPAHQTGVVMGIHASLTPSQRYYLPPSFGHKNGQKVSQANIVLIDYQARNDSITTGAKQLQRATIDYSETKSIPNEKLKRNASNVLEITGAVTGHALVIGCSFATGAPGGGVQYSLIAKTFASADAAAQSLSFLSDPKYLIEATFQKYKIGPVTYAGKKYNLLVSASGQPPGTTNANVSLYRVKGGGSAFWWGSTLVKGSITIGVYGYHYAFTFNHVVLQPTVSESNPPSGPVTISGKAYCRGGWEPLPPGLFVPAHTLTGNYSGTVVLSNGKRTTEWLEFGSRHIVNVQFASEEARIKHKFTYKFNGDVLLLQASHYDEMSGFAFKVDSNGCFDTPHNSKLCKTAAPTPAAMKAMEIKNRQQNAAAIAAERKKMKALELVPQF